MDLIAETQSDAFITLVLSNKLRRERDRFPNAIDALLKSYDAIQDKEDEDECHAWLLDFFEFAREQTELEELFTRARAEQMRLTQYYIEMLNDSTNP